MNTFADKLLARYLRALLMNNILFPHSPSFFFIVLWVWDGRSNFITGDGDVNGHIVSKTTKIFVGGVSAIQIASLSNLNSTHGIMLLTTILQCALFYGALKILKISDDIVNA